MVRRTRKQQKSRSRRQHGGGWGYSGTALTTPGGVPVENRVGYDHCYDDMRVGPSVGSPTLWGGSRKHRSSRKHGGRKHGGRKHGGRKHRGSRKQQGGNCSSCVIPAPAMNGGGAGTGGYALTFDNSLGKVYAEAVKAPCPTQAGGASIYEHVAYPASYGYDTGSAFLSDSAHFLIPNPDVSRCASGGRRKSHRKSHRRSRRHH
jgi:hypothetical protein